MQKIMKVRKKIMSDIKRGERVILTRSERVINHIVATLELYYSSLIEINNCCENDMFISNAVLGTRRGKRYVLKYTFRNLEERQMFISEFMVAFPDVQINERGRVDE